MKAQTRRDLTIIPISERDSIVIACDSCGAVGLKDADVLQLPPRYAAKFTARVALTEVLCSGAAPVTVINGAACEMHPTGEETIAGVREELMNAGIADIALTGSTEENFQTSMTALAVTVIGIAENAALRFEPAGEGDRFVLLGRPVVGAEVDVESMGFYTEIKHLLQMPGVKEIVPVGSKGAAYEAKTLACLNGMACELYDTGIDYKKSAGPATCLLVLCEGPVAGRLLKTFPAATVIGGIVTDTCSS